MNKNLADLYLQRGQLLERIASQRLVLARQLEPLQQAAETGGRVLALLRDGLQSLKNNPLPVLLAVAVLVLLKPRRTWRWLQRGLFVWRRWRVLRSWLPTSLLSRWLMERVSRRG